MEAELATVWAHGKLLRYGPCVSRPWKSPSLDVSQSPAGRGKLGEVGEMGGNGKWGEMGGDGGKWREVGGKREEMGNCYKYIMENV